MIKDLLQELRAAQSVAIRERVRRGMTLKAEQGVFLGRPPLGYRNVRDLLGSRIEVDPLFAPLVRRIFEVAAKGGTPRAVAEELIADGFRARHDRPITSSTVVAVLLNPAYAGDVRFRGNVYAGCHQALISRELARAAERVLTRLS